MGRERPWRSRSTRPSGGTPPWRRCTAGPLTGGSPEQADREEAAAAVAGRALSETLDQWREKYPEVQVRQDVVRAHPGRVLALYAARADLVVIGRSVRGGTGPVIGAVQHSLLGHARGPVAVVPSPN